MNPKLKEKTLESLSAVLPITGIVLLISVLIVPMELGTVAMFLTGAVLLIIGMGFFQLGAEMSMTPIGEGIGAQISKVSKVPIALFIGLIMGIIITISEPDLQVLAEQVSINNWVLIITVAVGVGIFLAVSIHRILFQINLSVLLTVLYVLLLIGSFFIPKDFLAVAFDSGGVTTGPMTVPFIMAMGVGLASVRSDKNATSDSFGLVALSSVGPILAVLILSLFYRPSGNSDIESTVIPSVETTKDVASEFVNGFPKYIEEVLISILPIILVFAVFQFFCRRYPKSQIKRVIVGFVYTCLGLILFLCGVNIGFAPAGASLGSALAGGAYKWGLIPIGALVGYYIVKAEPAIQVLNHQVEGVTNGAISVKAMNRAMSIGVSVSVGLSMLRVLTGIPIQWIIIPGYLIALVLSRLVPRIFVGIAFDSGGVASGPMTTTFLLPLSMGVCRAVGGNIMRDAFGVVALVALTPLITIQIMGLWYQFKTRDTAKNVPVPVPEAQVEVDEIFEFEEDD